MNTVTAKNPLMGLGNFFHSMLDKIKSFFDCPAEREILKEELQETKSILKKVLASQDAQSQMIEELRGNLSTVQSMADTDSLTKLYSRGFLERGNVEKIIALCQRNKNPWSTVMIDIDHFKKVNDTYGHSVGDLAIKHVAEIIHKVCRNSDYAIRYGGEEFLVILPNTDISGLTEFCNRMLKEIRETKFPYEPTLNLRVSIGACTASKDTTLKSAISNSDSALYTSKGKGRDQFTLFE